MTKSIWVACPCWSDLLIRSFALVFAVTLSAIACHAQQRRPQPSGPSLRETRQWMQAIFAESLTLTDKRAGQMRALTFSECTVTVRQDWVTPNGPPVRRETIIDLSLIDPQSIQSYHGDLGSEKGIAILMMSTTNDKRVITATTENSVMKTRIDKPFSSQHLWLYFVRPDYAEHFADALRHVVEICGGKPSTFQP